jgi:tRNA(Ile2) C34 agmatinyltransferase TiaS
VIACCPDCGTELHANGDGWWCPAQELGFSAAELTGAGL